jgi:hypothetical protein
MPRGKPDASLEERFLKKTIVIGDCWMWAGGITTNGYGQLLKKTYGTTYAHQWSCHIWKGSPLPIEKGMCIKHSCDNKRCVNPEHLTYGTLQENIQEMVERNPKAMGRIVPTEQELIKLKELILTGISRREISRKIGHSRHWIDRIIKEHITEL